MITNCIKKISKRCNWAQTNLQPFDLKKLTRNMSNAPNETECEFCGTNFKTRKDLETHTKNIHNCKITHVCNICTQVFQSSRNLSNHIKYLHGLSNYKYNCEYCKKRFLKEISLKLHIKRRKSSMDISIGFLVNKNQG